MGFVEEIAIAEAGSDLRALYDEIAAAWEGELPPVLQVLGLAPDALREVSRQARAISYGSSALGIRREEMIATVVSRLNGCEPLLVAHGERLRAATGDDLLVYHLQREHALADLEEQERALLAYVVKLNGEPGEMGEADLEGLRKAGFDDREILDIVMLTALTYFMVTVAGGLGVETGESLSRARAAAERKVEDELRGASGA